MKSKVLTYMILTILILGTGIAFAYENITAEEAYEMVNDGEAILIDVRTLEECYWVGMPNVPDGWLYVIPWFTFTISADGTLGKKTNPDFGALVSQEFGDNLDQALITMCSIGGRGTLAAKAIDALKFTNVYEVDNALKEAENGWGGRGGFQGTNYDSDYDGYSGYPARLPHNQSPKKVTVQTSTNRIRNPESSVSWMDTGLPIIQQDLTKAVIPELAE